MAELEWRLVTGCTQGIGRSVAELLARAHPEDGVILACRDAERGHDVAEDLVRKTGNSKIRLEQVDCSSFQSVCDLGRRLEGQNLRLRALVNNAAECPRTRLETEAGIERQLATNVLGYHWMIRQLAQLLQATARSTGKVTYVVNVASDWAGDLDLNDLEFQKRHYDPDTAYRQSKQANRMLTVTWAEKLGPDVLVNACHPGDPCTKLSCSLGYNMYATKDCTGAARLPMFLASDPAVAQNNWTGLWFPSRVPSPCRFASPSLSSARAQLFAICEGYCSSDV